MKKQYFLLFAIVLSIFSAPSLYAAGRLYYENNSIPDKVHVLKIDNYGSTGNFVILESNNKFAIIDAGALRMKESESVVYPFIDSLGIKEFEFVLVSHFDEDHFSYLTNGSYGATRFTREIDRNTPLANGTLPDRYKIKKLLARDGLNARATYATEDFNRLRKSFAEQGILTEWHKNINFGDFKLKVVNEHLNSQAEIDAQKNHYGRGVANLDSVGVLVEKNGYKMFIGNDIEKYDEYDMIKSGEIQEIGDVDVYVMNHHGQSNTSNTEEFLDAIKAEVYIVTGDEKRFKTEPNAYHNRGTTDQILKMYSSKVGGIDNILFNSNGTISVDFTDTRNGISVDQNLLRSYSKKLKNNIDVSFDELKEVNLLYEKEDNTSVDISANPDKHNTPESQSGQSSGIKAPNTGFSQEIIALPMILAAMSLIISIFGKLLI